AGDPGQAHPDPGQPGTGHVVPGIDQVSKAEESEKSLSGAVASGVSAIARRQYFTPKAGRPAKAKVPGRSFDDGSVRQKTRRTAVLWQDAMSGPFASDSYA